MILTNRFPVPFKAQTTTRPTHSLLEADWPSGCAGPADPEELAQGVPPVQGRRPEHFAALRGGGGQPRTRQGAAHRVRQGAAGGAQERQRRWRDTHQREAKRSGDAEAADREGVQCEHEKCKF